MPKLALYFFGAPRIELDGTAVFLSHSRALALLAYLSLNPQPHTRQSLAALFWPHDDTAVARRELRRMLWVLNKSLGQTWLTLEHQMVQLPSNPNLWLDIDHFRTLLSQREHQNHPADEVCSLCQERLTNAIALARDDFLSGFTLPDCPEFDQWQAFETETLRQELSDALQRLVQLLIRSKDRLSDEAINYTRRWLNLDPLHEPAHRQLMELYALSGQQAAALRQFHQCVQLLKSELGVLPAPETTALYETIKANRLPPLKPTAVPEKPVLEVVPSDDYDLPLRPSTNPKLETVEFQSERALPAQPTIFIGRQHEIAAVCQLLTRESQNGATHPVRLVTLTGPGGTGKTRLSLQVAAELQDYFADGVYFVPLAGLNDPQLFASAIARQLNVREGGGQPILPILKSALKEKILLLVLDNFEQIMTAAPILADLLAAAPQLKVIVTSRERLHLRAEYEFMVSPLELPQPSQNESLVEIVKSEAVQLFVERAEASSAVFTLTQENAPTVAEICRRLDGLPLAIELAAARVKLLSPEMLLDRLNRRLALLTGGSQDLPVRQQTLRKTIDWSYSLLNPAEQTLFSFLAVFVGGFTLDSAEAVCAITDLPAGEELPIDILDGVTSLLNKSLLVQQDCSSSQPRFRILETIREYALERLIESGNLEMLQKRHTHYFANQIEEIGANLNFRKGDWIDWADEEYNNLQAALAWVHAREAEVHHGLNMIGVLYWFWYRRGFFSEGRAWCQRFMALPSLAKPTAEKSYFLIGSGSMALIQGDMAEAEQQLQEAVTIAQTIEDESLLVSALTSRGVLARYQGHNELACRLFQETLRLGNELNQWWFIVNSQLNLANVSAANGNFATAHAQLEQAAVLAKSNDDNWLLANGLNNMGEVARIQGDYETAEQSYTESQQLFCLTGDKPDIARALHNLGYVAQHKGDNVRAEALFRESLTIFQELGNKRGMTECLAGLAGLMAERDETQVKRAAGLLAAAEAQLQNSNSSWWSADQVEFDRNLSAIQTTLNLETLETIWHEGKTMTLADAITEVLS